ncbi:MAG: hypothetical protein NC124_03170, partial [Clostridium sp.]|nr:hypothetical protein [Clostridium sp.]
MGNKSSVTEKIERILHGVDISNFPLNFMYYISNNKLKTSIYNHYEKEQPGQPFYLDVNRKYTPYDELQLRTAISQKKNIYLGILFSQNEIFEKILLAKAQLSSDNNLVAIFLTFVGEINQSNISEILAKLSITIECFSHEHRLLDLYKH